MKTKKMKGFMLLPAVLMSILLGLIGLSFLQIYTGQFNAMSSGRKALQALQYAQSEADYLRNVDYANLASSAHTRMAIAGATGWQSQVAVGDETEVSGVKQRMATVNVYRNSTVTTPDYSLQVPLSSADGGGDGNSTEESPETPPEDGEYTKLPDGTIIQWGSVECRGAGVTPVTFKLTFPKYCSSVIVTRHANGGYATPMIYNYPSDSISQTGFKLVHDFSGSSIVSYVAFGR